MAKILYIGTHGPVDPTRATLPFLLSTGAIEGGHRPSIALLTEAVTLIRDDVAAQVHGVGFPPLTEILPKLVEHEVPVAI